MKADNIYSVLLLCIILGIAALLMARAKQDISQEKVQTCVQSAVDAAGTKRCIQARYTHP